LVWTKKSPQGEASECGGIAGTKKTRHLNSSDGKGCIKKETKSYQITHGPELESSKGNWLVIGTHKKHALQTPRTDCYHREKVSFGKEERTS